ncbi:MAG: ribonuclease HII [Clostridiaceae bacterium]
MDNDISLDLESMNANAIKLFVKETMKECIAAGDDFTDRLKADKRASVNALADTIIKTREKLNLELDRVKTMYDFDRKFGKLVAGVDEVGRGPLAGPIVGACVILEEGPENEDLILGLNDSKKLSKKKREELYPIIIEKAAAWAIFEHSNEDIDKLGVSFCNNHIFIGAIKNLKIKPEFILSDGYPIRGIDIRGRSIIKGDSKSACIAAASIIAKVYRDRLMEEMDGKYPGYGFDMNSGYGSAEHIHALKTLGPCPIHRRSYIRNIVK